MHPTISRPWLFLGVALLVGQIPQAAAFPSYLNTWKGLYPASSSGDNANCALCHNSFSSGSGFNPYGSAVRNASGSTSTQIQAVEGFDSDNDPTGSNNLAEIEASTQPGWTGSAPSGVTGNLDPVATPMPNIVVNPTALNFSTVTVGNSPTLTTTVQNTGTADLNVSGVNLGTGTSTEFGVTSPVGGFTVGAGMSQVVTVQYMPLDMGPDSGSIDINSNDPDSATVSVALSGTGTAPPAPDINLVPAGIDLGTIEIGSFGSQTVSIQNLGDASLGIGPISRCTGTSPEFTWSLANTLVPASGSTTLTVEYTPSGVGTDTGCLEIGSNDPDEPSVQLDVAGTGTLTAVPDIALDPASLDFGALTVNDTATLSAQIRNLGSAALTVTGIAAAPGTSGEYAVTAPTTPFTIAAGNSETLSVAYTPTDEGLDIGSVALSSDDPDEPQVSLDLSGSGNAAVPPDISLNPAALAFGTVTIGNSESLTAMVHNLGGEPLSVSLVDRCTGTSTEFSWSPTTAFTVPAGSSQSLTVSYAPVNEGLDQGCLTVASNDPDEASVELGVSGTGQTPQGTADVVIEVPESIDPDSDGMTSVRFSASGADVAVDKVRCGRDDEKPTRINVEDFNNDGFTDSVALFDTEELQIECGDTSLACSGMLGNGTDFTGTSNSFVADGEECGRGDDEDDEVEHEDEAEEDKDGHGDIFVGCTVSPGSPVDPTLPTTLVILGLAHALRRRCAAKR